MAFVVQQLKTPASQTLARTMACVFWVQTGHTLANAKTNIAGHIVNLFAIHVPAFRAKITALVLPMAILMFALVFRASLELTASFLCLILVIHNLVLMEGLAVLTP